MGIKDRINTYWSERAEEFSGLRMKDFQTELREKYEDIIKEYVNVNVKTKALDIGTGAGFFSFILSDLGCKVTAIDYSSDMISMAKENAKNMGYKGIIYNQMDVEKLSFEDEKFDLIFTRNVTWTLENPEKAYCEMIRVLKKGGILINIDANYGKAFIEADKRGETPIHPTQTHKQLRERNDITKLLGISNKERPAFDAGVLLSEGVTEIKINTKIEEKLGNKNLTTPYKASSKSSDADMFLIVVKK